MASATRWSRAETMLRHLTTHLAHCVVRCRPCRDHHPHPTAMLGPLVCAAPPCSMTHMRAAPAGAAAEESQQTCGWCQLSNIHEALMWRGFLPAEGAVCIHLYLSNNRSPLYAYHFRPPPATHTHTHTQTHTHTHTLAQEPALRAGNSTPYNGP
jgi:hypothetical protein